jgi:hypothetical protein
MAEECHSNVRSGDLLLSGRGGGHSPDRHNGVKDEV